MIRKYGEGRKVKFTTESGHSWTEVIDGSTNEILGTHLGQEFDISICPEPVTLSTVIGIEIDGQKYTLADFLKSRHSIQAAT